MGRGNFIETTWPKTGGETDPQMKTRVLLSQDVGLDGGRQKHYMVITLNSHLVVCSQADHTVTICQVLEQIII